MSCCDFSWSTAVYFPISLEKRDQTLRSRNAKYFLLGSSSIWPAAACLRQVMESRGLLLLQELYL